MKYLLTASALMVTSGSACALSDCIQESYDAMSGSRSSAIRALDMEEALERERARVDPFWLDDLHRPKTDNR